MKVCSFCRRCYDDSVFSCDEESHGSLAEMRNCEPDLIAGYRLDSLLESGVAGDIYRAHQTASGGPCLIKILSADIKNSERFQLETKLASTIFHPNLADVYEAGSLETGECFVIYEDADGQTLRELLDNSGVPPLLTTIQVMCQAAEALHALHLTGLTHRAVNPENIVLASDAEGGLLVRIQNPDFGGVFERSIISNKFLIDSALDSIKYFAPEQFDGAESSAQTDVYSLGVVFYEMLAGVPPFNGSKAAELIEKHKKQRPPDLRIDNFDLRMLITHSLMESLQKRPDLRQSSANAFARQIRHIEQLATHVSTPPPAVPQKQTAVAFAVPHQPLQTFPVRHAVVEMPNTHVESLITAEVECGPAAAQEANNRSGTADYYENIPPGWHEYEPVNTFEVENETTANFARESAIDPVDEPVIDLIGNEDNSMHDLNGAVSEPKASETAADVFMDAAAVKDLEKATVLPVPRLPRLKLRMKRHRHETARLVSEIRESNPLPIFEPAETDLGHLRVEPFEMPVVLAEPEHIADVPAYRKPVLIAWEQPEDDIPSEADVFEALAKDQMMEAPVAQATRENVADDQAYRKPTLIEWKQPDNDIPSEADVLSMEKMTEFTIIQPKIEEIAEVSVFPTPPIIELGHFSVQAPPKAAVQQVRAREEMAGVSVLEPEPEEITAVRAYSKPIKIEWETYKAPQDLYRFLPSATDEVGFYPTILGEPQKRSTVDSDPLDPMFSAFYVPPQAGFRRRHSFLIGGGSVALIAAFVLGADFLGIYFGMVESGESLVVETTSSKETPPNTARTDAFLPSQKKPVKTFTKPLAKDIDDDVREVQVLPAKVSVPASLKRSRPQTEPISPSTLVISSDNGKVRSRSEPNKRSANESPLSAPKQGANGTRPRIVKILDP